MNKILKHDFVIPAGTVFKDAPIKTQRNGSHMEAIIGLSKDSTAFFTLDLEDAPSDLFE